MRSPAAVFLFAITACAGAPARQVATPPAAREPAAATVPREAPNQEINDRYQRQIAEQIGSRKHEPAGQLFKNIQLDGLKDVPGDTFLVIMNVGYARALGVRCTHCHVEEDFASDAKRPKRAAREMAVMHRMINQRLSQMENLEPPPDKRSINCFSCHRGAIDPR